ncbi:hypothetical protein [Nocardioides sp. R-C-SC26]|uniref:hypothetical protein n=1 Tax=Nocardioides sp. R-C-SC26 TaxID=2870414 RepID=UPI001E34BCBC|nr:hypothetical protein [Nocardioides sp. R-C-SC26]
MTGASRQSRSLTIDVPDIWWLSLNDRLHHMKRATYTRALRGLGFVSARNARIRDLGTTHVVAYIGYPKLGRADPMNAAPTTKALIDGFVDAGVWPDDDSRTVLGPTHLRDPKPDKTGIYRIRFLLIDQDPSWLDEIPTTREDG